MAVSRNKMIEFLLSVGIGIQSKEEEFIVDMLAKIVDDKKIDDAIREAKLRKIEKMEKAIQDQQYIVNKLKEDIGVKQHAGKN